MKLAVVCANGKAGLRIVEEAVSRGLDVTAVVREENRSAARAVIRKDLFDLTAADLAGFDAVVDAFGAWTPETLPLHSQSLAHLCDILSGTPTRLLVVGGAGSLYVNPEHWKKYGKIPEIVEARDSTGPKASRSRTCCLSFRRTHAQRHLILPVLNCCIYSFVSPDSSSIISLLRSTKAVIRSGLKVP